MNQTQKMIKKENDMTYAGIDADFLLAHNKEHKKFKLEKGMRINIYGSKYKIQVIKPNGDLKLRFEHYDVAEAAKWENK